LEEASRKAAINVKSNQLLLKFNFQAVERRCRVTGVTDPRLLRASHIKPWSSCSTIAERLDGYNGLLLCPNVDHLFDRGYISFGDDGTILVSPLIDAAQIALLGVATAPPTNAGPFGPGQAAYLAFHRESVFLHGR
jgi:hypothetical protein